MQLRVRSQPASQSGSAMTFDRYRDIFLRSRGEDWIRMDGILILKANLHVRVEREDDGAAYGAAWLGQSAGLDPYRFAYTLWFGASPVSQIEMVQAAPGVEIPLPSERDGRLIISSEAHHLAELTNLTSGPLKDYLSEAGIEVAGEAECEPAAPFSGLRRLLETLVALPGRRWRIHFTRWRSVFRRLDG
jgi:hypothetical protein